MSRQRQNFHLEALSSTARSRKETGFVLVDVDMTSASQPTQRRVPHGGFPNRYPHPTPQQGKRSLSRKLPYAQRAHASVVGAGPDVDLAHGSGVTDAQGGSSVEGAGQLSRPVWAALIVGGKATS